jgi:hypothetical protein
MSLICEGASLLPLLLAARDFQKTPESALVTQVLRNFQQGILEGEHITTAFHCFLIAKPSGAASFIMDMSPWIDFYILLPVWLYSAATILQSLYPQISSRWTSHPCFINFRFSANTSHTTVSTTRGADTVSRVCRCGIHDRYYHAMIFSGSHPHPSSMTCHCNGDLLGWLTHIWPIHTSGWHSSHTSTAGITINQKTRTSLHWNPQHTWHT